MAIFQVGQAFGSILYYLGFIVDCQACLRESNQLKEANTL